MIDTDTNIPTLADVAELVLIEAEDNVHGKARSIRPRCFLSVVEKLISAGITLASDTEQLRLRLQTVYVNQPNMFFLNGSPPFKNLENLKLAIANWGIVSPSLRGPKGTKTK